MSPPDLSTVLAAIEVLRERTGTEICLPENETVRDGSRVMLRSPEGWFIDVTGGALVPECEYPSLGLSLRGFILNPKRDVLEALTLYPALTRNTTADLDILDPKFDFAGYALETLVPHIREGAAKVGAKWAAEDQQASRIAQLQAHFGMEGLSKKIATPAPVNAEISVRASAVDKADVSMCINAYGLTPVQLEAVLAILAQPGAAATE